MFRRLTAIGSKRIFLQMFSLKTGFKIPIKYIEHDDVWAYVVNGNIAGGFAIVTNRPEHCRLFKQIKDSDRRRLANYYWDHVTELTCFFIDNDRYSFKIKLGMMLKCLFYPAQYFFYSYETDKEGLASYYAQGKPTVYYRGPVIQLEGMPDNPKDESIEYLTKLGIIRIFVLSTLKQIKRRIRKLWQR